MAGLGMSPENEAKFNSYHETIETALSRYLDIHDDRVQITADAMRYSTMVGGKRLRPVLTLEFCRLCGGNPEDALPFACALEMVHTSSLIHDDLPCMDNDDYRRGKPSCHKKFGYNYALLAGDALEAYAFETAANATVDPKITVECLRRLTAATGIHGMLGGQTMDEANETKTDVDLARLTDTDALKTGAFIRVACEMGCLSASASKEQMDHAIQYGNALGVAFQIQDDILDVIGDEKKLGKAVGSDKESHKATYVGLLGLEGSQKRAVEFTDKALQALDIFPDNDFIKELTSVLLKRDH